MTASSLPPADRLLLLLESEGAISIADYMAHSNAHYYATRDPLGAAGDFTTAPEISQMFGELIGLCLADLWLRAGGPPAALVELGPGRGTLMADIRRVAARVPGLADAPVHFIETSPALREEQRKRVPGAVWHDDPSTLPDDRALLIVANEFFDALPVRQIVRSASGWHERMVTIDDGRIVPAAGPLLPAERLPAALAESPPGTIIETSPASLAVMADLSHRLAEQGGAALIVDYGYAGPATGDTLQAVREHRYADAFSMFGEADLTAHVDFSALAKQARAAGLDADGPVAQGTLLRALGIEARADALAAANPARKAAIDIDVSRLTAADQMGRLFKALAIRPAHWPAPAGFGEKDDL